MAKVTDTSDAPFFEPHQVPLGRPYFDEREPEAAAAVVRSGMLCQGDVTRQLEERFAERIGAAHAVAVSSGSTALLVALQAMGVGSGDEVIVPDMTFVATATAPMYLGARPVLCDIELSRYNIDSERIEALIGERTRAVVPVHYGGQTADMDAINEIARRRGLLVLEDAAEAHLSRYRGGGFAGTLGDAGIFSFTPTKPMTTGEGGMIVTGDADLAERCRRIRNFGDRAKFDWYALGFNFRMTDIAAAIGLVQLDKLDDIVAMRRRLAARYDEAFAAIDGIIPPALRQPGDTNHTHYTIRVDAGVIEGGRDRLASELARRGISSRVYFPALHRMQVMAPALAGRGDADFPASLAFEESALSLPIFTAMSDAEQAQVIAAVAEVAGQRS